MNRIFAATGRRTFAQFKPKELIESYWEVQKKAEELATFLQTAKYPIIFTGAGISTSIGIPDYRSGAETIIKTGPGLWNRNLQQPSPHETPIDKLVDLAHPSPSHMFISTLIDKGIIKHLISQNTDGLHLKSGVPIHNISELHGNRNLEFCTRCSRKYSRDFRTLRRDGKKYYPGEKRDHSTGRSCENCGGELHDSIVYFGEKLPTQELENAYRHATQADLCICIGSSLTVKPSSSIPALVGQRGKLCIINIQQTPLDHFASLRISYFCDDVLELLSRMIDVPIQKLVVEHFLRISSRVSEGEVFITIEGKDKSDNNLSFKKAALLTYLDGHSEDLQVVGHRCEVKLTQSRLKICKSLTIFHYADKPPLQVLLSDLNIGQPSECHLSYQLQDSQTWKLQIHS